MNPTALAYDDTVIISVFDCKAHIKKEIQRGK